MIFSTTAIQENARTAYHQGNLITANPYLNKPGLIAALKVTIWQEAYRKAEEAAAIENCHHE